MPNDRPYAYVAMSYQRTTLRIFLVLLLLMINHVTNLESTSQRHSGVLLKNKGNQTTTHRLPTDATSALEHAIWKHLGHTTKPKNTKNKTTLIETSARKFLINIYKHIEKMKSAKKESANKKSSKKPNEGVETSEFHLTRNDLRTTKQSDVIITFRAQQSHQRAERKPDGTVMRIWFDVSRVPSGLRVISAQLRLYRGLDAKNLENRGAFTVAAYRIRRPKDDETEMQFVDSANTAAEHEGWITLNVTESLTHWMRHPNDNKGLYVSVRPIGRSSHVTGPEDIGIVRFDGDTKRQPFMAGFFRRNERRKSGFIRPSLRSFEVYDKRNKKRNVPNRNSGYACKVQKRYVSFEDLHWDWIIHPPGYEANYCSGKCEFPLTSHMNATNHAILQAIVHTLRAKKMPEVCCVPTKLSAIDVLYYVDDNIGIVSKRGLPDMSVKACGCR